VVRKKSRPETKRWKIDDPARKGKIVSSTVFVPSGKGRNKVSGLSPEGHHEKKTDLNIQEPGHKLVRDHF